MDIVIVFKQSYIRDVRLNIRSQCDSGRVTMSMREVTHPVLQAVAACADTNVSEQDD